MNCSTQLSYHTRKDGTASVKLCVTHEGDRRYISTGLFVLPEQLNDKGIVSKSHPMSRQYNAKIAGLRNEIETFLLAGCRLPTQRYQSLVER